MFLKIDKYDSSNENVSKFIFTKDDAIAEAVLYKYPTYEERTVICCSTQSGCKMGCRFCGSGDYFVRSFNHDEIVYQPDYLLKQTGVNPQDIKKLQIMFMSMGEPMHNWSELQTALWTLYHKYPHARLLISTSAPKVWKDFKDLNEWSKLIPAIGLQFSVHESTDEARKKLIPTESMTLCEMAKTGEEWHHATGRRPFFNYCVHDKNNTQEDVDRLAKIFSPKIWEATISVICERGEDVSASNNRQRQLALDFMDKMIAAKYSTRCFDPAGQDDIAGGCGQLWQTQKWMKDNPLAKPSKGLGLPILHTPTDYI